VKISLRPTYSSVASTLALVVALSTAGYAAVSLPENSVGSPQLKKGAVHAADLGKDAVSGKKVKNGSLRASDFRVGDLPVGPQGPQGLPGAGLLGFASFGPGGAIVPGSSWGAVTGANLDVDTVTGVYCFNFPGVAVKSAMVSADLNGFGSDFIANVKVDPGGITFGDCSGTVVVSVERPSSGRTDWGFHLWLAG
jgi:hypothetical protein